MKLLNNELVHNLEKNSIFYLGCLACILIFFQTNFGFNQFEINLNLSDIIAIAAGSMLILQRRDFSNVQTVLPKIHIFLFLMLGAFAYALICGWYKFGLTSYALINKFLGLFILFGYAMLGASFKMHFKKHGEELLIKIMLTTLMVILAFKLCINLLYFSHVLGNKFIINPILCGYSNNRNTFAIQLMCIAYVSMIYFPKNYKQSAFLFSAIILTYSRSALITLAILGLVIFCTQIVDRKSIYKQALTILTFTAGILGLEWFCTLIPEFTSALRNASGIGSTKEFILDLYSYDTSNTQRLYTLFEALRLWLQEPFSGIGLGGFVLHEFNKNQIFLVIHNTFIWILTEFGLVGASVFIWYGCITLQHFYRRSVQTAVAKWSLEEKALAGLLVIFISMGNAHEILYQRIFWLMFGLFIIVPKINTPLLFSKTSKQML